MRIPTRDGLGNGEKSPEAARDPLTECSGGSDRTLPPSVRSILERSSFSRIGTGRIWWSMTERRQGLVSQLVLPSIDRTLDPLLTGRTDVASDHSIGSSSPPVN